jgi:hypothetical protein
MLPPMGFILRGIDRDLWRRFKAYCALRGTSMRVVILDLVRRVVDGEIDLDKRKSDKTKDKK